MPDSKKEIENIQFDRRSMYLNHQRDIAKCKKFLNWVVEERERDPEIEEVHKTICSYEYRGGPPLEYIQNNDFQCQYSGTSGYISYLK